jgi:hypothetical protein
MRPFLSQVPPFQRLQGTPDRRPAGLGLRHRPARAATTANSYPVVRLTAKKKQSFPTSWRIPHILARISAPAGAGGGRASGSFSSRQGRGSRFLGFVGNWLAREEDDGEGEERGGGGVRASSWTRARAGMRGPSLSKVLDSRNRWHG